VDQRLQHLKRNAQTGSPDAIWRYAQELERLLGAEIPPTEQSVAPAMSQDEYEQWESWSDSMRDHICRPEFGTWRQYFQTKYGQDVEPCFEAFQTGWELGRQRMAAQF
jgi:hypothetical protein